MCVKKIQWYSSPATLLEYSDPRQVCRSTPNLDQAIVSSWTSQCRQHAPQALCCPDGKWAPTSYSLCCPSLASSSHTSEGCLLIAWSWSNPVSFLMQWMETTPQPLTRSLSQLLAGRASLLGFFLL